MSTLQNLIEQSNGKFVSVTFTKKDGSTRVLVGRLGVTKGLKGGKSTLDPEKFITIFDVQADGYRAINRETIQSVRIDGKEFTA
jgi:hypothetical protein|tara:strand:- start:605 stop:856 length:252 start_codon:yes stop_codon:yes gene_type:complete